MLRLHDTATGTVRTLELRDPGRVAIYVCGLTVSGPPHIGHARGWLVYDVLRRYLTFRDLDVHHVSNVTDIEDKIIGRAAADGRTESDVAREFEAALWAASDALGVLRPNDMPHATEYVEEMVALVVDLVERGVAYETSSGVYLSVEKVEGYGLLAHQSLDSLQAGARVEVDAEKRSPLDFVLWKKAKPGEPTWNSPFGPGRPGWHTECVVMSLGLLGDGFDLHGGGMDLIFPHHENERAQAVAQGRPYARHWTHWGWVMTGSDKMSKSLDNFVTVADMLEQGDPRAYRLLVLRSQYRSQIDVTPESRADASKALERLDGLARRFGLGADRDLQRTAVAPAAAGDVLDGELAHFCSRMDDDLDTPGAMAGIFDAVGRAHSLADAGRDDEAHSLASSIEVLCAVVGLQLRGADESGLDVETASLVTERDAARAAGDYRRGDEIRDRLSGLGWIVEDGPEGTTVRRR